MKSVSRLWGDKIIAGDKTYAEVPAQLLEEVKEYLTEKGHADLAKTKKKASTLKATTTK